MCYWGAAYVLGPNINAPMEQSSVIEAYKLTQKAIEVSKKGTEKEIDLINALSKRYGSKPVEDRSSFEEFSDKLEGFFEHPVVNIKATNSTNKEFSLSISFPLIPTS